MTKPNKYFVKRVVFDEVKIVKGKDGFFTVKYTDGTDYWKDVAVFESEEACLSFLKGATQETIEVKNQVWHIIHH